MKKIKEEHLMNCMEITHAESLGDILTSGIVHEAHTTPISNQIIQIVVNFIQLKYYSFRTFYLDCRISVTCLAFS